MNFAVITENDESQWRDQTGEVYHFPKRYLDLLKPGTKVVYYKGRLKNKVFSNKRLSIKPHYFGIGEISQIKKDPRSSKEDYFANITNFFNFQKPVPFIIEGNYLEEIPPSKASNFWRDGVRKTSERTYERILKLAEITDAGDSIYNDERIQSPSFDSEFYEGGMIRKYTTVFERDPRAREQAITIHGLTCKACGLNFEEFYGEWGNGYIHVHHIKPISSVTKKDRVKPETDLTVLCANCHSMVHRRRDQLLSVEELKNMIKSKRHKPL